MKLELSTRIWRKMDLSHSKYRTVVGTRCATLSISDAVDHAKSFLWFSETGKRANIVCDNFWAQIKPSHVEHQSRWAKTAEHYKRPDSHCLIRGNKCYNSEVLENRLGKCCMVWLMSVWAVTFRLQSESGVNKFRLKSILPCMKSSGQYWWQYMSYVDKLWDK